MLPSQTALLALVAVAMSSLVNGAVVQRDGTFTFITPQPTSPMQGAPSTTTTSQTPTTTPTQTTTPTASPTVSTTPRTTTSSSATVVVTPTTTTTPCPTTTTPTAVVTPPTTTPPPCTTSCPPVVVTPPTTSTTPCPTTTPTVVVTPPTTTPCPTTSTPVVTPCPKCTPSTPSTPVTGTPAPGGGASCTGVQQWQASFAYTAGNQVIFNNQLFTARQWTFNNEPPAHPDQWTAGGTCAQPINNKANCAGIAAWQSNVAYTTGNQVTFNNHLWSAVQWAQSNPPGDTSGSWKDLGACA